MWSGLICPAGNCSSCIGWNHKRLVVGQTVLEDGLLLGLRAILAGSRFERSFVLLMCCFSVSRFPDDIVEIEQACGKSIHPLC